jgi:zinc transport system substrate-binding protein
MFLALMIGCAMAACSGKTTDSEPTSTPELGTLTVHATSYPLAFFAERIGGDAVDVDFPVPADIDPAHWSPDPDAVARAQRADLLLRSGAGDPAWLDLASLHGERVVDTTATVRDRLLERETAVHQHGPDGKHSHGTWAGSTWLDPTLAVAQAEAIAAAFAAKRPEHAESFRSNLAALARELVELDRGLASSTPIPSTPTCRLAMR